MNYTEAVTYLDSCIGLGRKFGLEPMRSVMSRMGDPQNRCRAIHVAGTNGKTSTSRMAGRVLLTQGYSPGVFISPHLQAVEERIAVNGRDVSQAQFAEAISEVADVVAEEVADGGRPLTYFELTTAAAFGHFRRAGVDAMVMEVGLGGRLDATNVMSAEVAVLTGLSFDHTEYLGDTLPQIAAEKLGIVGQGARLVCGSIPPEAAPVVERRARNAGADVVWLGKDFGVRSVGSRPGGGWTVTVDGLYGSYENLEIPLRGRHQTRNLAVAVAAAESWLEGALDGDRLRTGLSALSVPGRMELITLDSTPILLDGAHNPEACAVLAKSLAEEFGGRKWVGVLGMMRDKDLETMVQHLAPHLDRVVATRVDYSRALSPGAIAQRMEKVCDLEVTERMDPAEAVREACVVAGDRGRVLVAGSLYLVGEVRTLVGL
ncbi:MAG: bifunctional folylpolyglutamate synthase/dihydrofolate synthase [bacterium]|nr:bifunctional folylpolyglutamate synthase/dihydrofolate synthase [bacterium]